ncbi:MAG: dihydrolipoamide acetyltransferase family protein [Pseudomonadota bacterium]
MSEYIFKLPDLGEGTVEAEIAEWHIKVGDVVEEEDTLGAMMTDKAAVEVSSPVAGRVIALAGEPGDVIAVGTPLVTFDTTGNAAPPVPADEATQPVASHAEPTVDPATAKTDEWPIPTAQAASSRVQTSPAIRRMAREAGIDLATVVGTGPRGRIVREDFDNHVARERGARLMRAPASVTRSGTEEIKVIGVRRMIAERMSAAKRNIPHFSYVEEVDLSALESLRTHLNADVVDRSDKLTPLAFIALALIRTINEFPQVNAIYDAERNTIVRHSAVHLGIATQTDDGLKVPVLKNAEQYELRSMAKAIRTASSDARNNRSKPQDLSGSTITLTSLGKLGGIASTPVINAPEVAIIGINKAVERPVVVGGQVVVRTMMNLSSSFDHRFVDGFDAAAMIQSLKMKLEQPALIFANL